MAVTVPGEGVALASVATRRGDRVAGLTGPLSLPLCRSRKLFPVAAINRAIRSSSSIANLPVAVLVFVLPPKLGKELCKS